MSQHFVPLSRKTSFAIGRSQRPSIASINDTTMEEDVDDKVGAEQNSTRALKRAFKRLSSSGARKSETEATPLLGPRFDAFEEEEGLWQALTPLEGALPETLPLPSPEAD